MFCGIFFDLDFRIEMILILGVDSGDSMVKEECDGR